MTENTSKAIEQLEEAGVFDAKYLSDEVKKRINSETSQETVDHLIAFKKLAEEAYGKSLAPLPLGDVTLGGVRMEMF